MRGSRIAFFAALPALASLTFSVACSKDKPACGADAPCPASASPATTNAVKPGVVVNPDGSVVSNSSSSSASSGAVEPEWIAPVLPTRSPGCGAAAPQPLAGSTFTTPSGRTFRVYAPANYDVQNAYPVALTYHGWYASGAAFQSWFHMESTVGNAGLTVYPDGVNGLWDLDGMSDVLFFDEMIKQVGDAYCINPARVLGFGFSFGGKFMNQLACKRAGYVKAITIGAGSDGGPGTGCGRLPVLFAHRTHDPDELIDWARGARDRWASRMGCSATPQASNAMFNCQTNTGCRSPGAVTFCEDTFFDAGWERDWNHTVRENYRAFAWQWFLDLP